MRRDHLPKEMREHHARTDALVRMQRITAFTRWTRETFSREPTKREIDQFLKGVRS